MKQIIDSLTGTILFSNASIADSFFKRLLGLMFRKEMNEEEILIFHRAGLIHTCFMRFPLDIIFLDNEMKVIKLCETVKSWRVVGCTKSEYTIECEGGQIITKNIKVGQTIQIKET